MGTMFLSKPRIGAAALWTAAAILAASTAAAQEPAAGAVPVIVAVDTSRSLSPAEIGAAVDRLRLALEALPQPTRVGLLAFDDQPRWILEPGASPSEAGAALQDLELGGSFTLLNDAVFVATRELPAGGVILLATDGRDENSATTVDDIARRCEALDIRILTLGIGEPLAERALRRLALVSNGANLGAVGPLDASAITRAVETARREIGERPRPGPSGTPSLATPATATSPDPGRDAGSGARPPSDASGQRPASDAGGPWYDDRYLALLLVAVLLIAGWWLWRRSRGSAGGERRDEVDDDLDADFQLQLAQRPTASLAEAPEVTVDTAVFDTPLGEALEKTRVLADQGVLIVRKSGQDPRLYLLGHDKAFSVGRSRDGNTLAVPDPALSSSHFKIVPEDRKYYLLDLGSTNGTFVNGHRTSAKELVSGDVLRAGQVEFEFQSQT
jgi:hypothetical protein